MVRRRGARLEPDVKRIILIAASLLAFFISSPKAQAPVGSQPPAQPSAAQTPPTSPQPAAPTSGRQSQVFRTAVDIVSLNVTVVDGANHYVTDLDQKDFNVFEDGAKQEINFFTRRQQNI